MNRMTINKPSASGRLMVISGMREPCTAFCDLVWTVNSLPQTEQREAFSARRVPQVGQSLVIGAGVSGLIGEDYTMSPFFSNVCLNRFTPSSISWDS